MIRNTPSPGTLRAAVKKCKTADEVFSILKTVEPFCIKEAENYLGYSFFTADGARDEVRIIGDVDIVPKHDIHNSMVGKAGEVVIQRHHESHYSPSPYPYDPKKNKKDELLRFSEESIVPEDFHIKKHICNTEVIISIGRVGFSKQAINKIGFDPVSIYNIKARGSAN